LVIAADGYMRCEMWGVGVEVLRRRLGRREE
jgi:hypothetical protein